MMTRVEEGEEEEEFYGVTGGHSDPPRYQKKQPEMARKALSVSPCGVERLLIFKVLFLSLLRQGFPMRQSAAS